MTTTDNRCDASGVTAGPPEATDAEVDAIFTAVADRRCRAVVDRPVGVDGCSVTFDDLAATLAGAPDGPDDRDRAETLLHHSLLPRLCDGGFAEYDADRGVVDYAGDDRLESALAAIERVTEGAPVAVDTFLDVLADDTRRRALRTLLVHEELTLADLADEVSAEQVGRPLSDIDPQTVLQTYLSLYHTHVPRLTDAGLAAYDQEHDLVAATDLGVALAPQVRTLCED